MTCAALFSRPGQAANYSLHRPRYTKELYKAILSQCPGQNMAVDIATGTGQAAGALAGQECGEARATFLLVSCCFGPTTWAHCCPLCVFFLAEHFSKVIAQDGSAEQLAHADRQHGNVEYQQADAHSTGLPDGCADLITVAQALHWCEGTEQGLGA